MKTLQPFSRRFDDIDLLLKGLPKIFPLLTSLASNPLMPDAKVRKFLHDINGCFNAMQLIECVFMDMAEGKVDLNASDAHALRNILKECNALHAYSLEVHKAYKGQIPWEDVEDPGVAKPNDMEKLELPRNLRVLLIDDDLTVHRRVKIDFEDDQVGAEVISIKNLAALREVLGAQEKPEIDLILLDHRLNRPFSEQQVWGHELISELREALPGALIVAHTSEAMDLNGDPDNPYANAAGGKVEIAGKHAAKAISGIVRRHLKRGVDKSAAE